MTQAVSIAQGGTNNVTMRNRIINGAMMIDQRNAGASVSIGTTAFPVDRFSASIQQGSGHTGQRSTTAPSGFVNSVLITVGTGASPAAGNVSRLVQIIEGFNVADFGWGTASAATITLSFWVRSSVTGTFAGGIYNGASNRTYVFTYAISAANTWEQKSITIAGDTSGTWATDNSVGFVVNWDLGTGSTYQGTAGSWAAGAAWATSGSVKLAATSGATFYITGVQLEAGTTATPFENRLYGTELQLCQRYYWQTSDSSNATGFLNVSYFTSTRCFGVGALPVTMRSTPTLATSTVSNFATLTALVNSVSAISLYGATANAFTLDITTSATTAGYAGFLRSAASVTALLAFSAEL